MVRIVKKPEERRKEIVETACRLFLTKGYDNTTMRNVMVELNIAKGTIYHYFKSKEEILDAVIEHTVDAEIHRLRLAYAKTRGNALERMREMIAESASEGHDDDFLERLHQPGNAGMHIRLLARLITEQAPIYQQLIEQGCREGIFKTDRPLESAEFILAGVQFLTDMGIYNWNQQQLARRAAALPAIIEAQLGAQAGAFAFLAEHLS